MRNSLSNVRQTRSQTRAQQANANLAPGNDDEKASSKVSDDSFVPSIVDRNGGELFDCAGCDRPNNSERYMVQCDNCDHWYHLTCAGVKVATVGSNNFVCAVCTSAKSRRARSQASGISSTSSARQSKVEREL
ncbi:transcription initiation factor TFIID subunit 3-like [Armigeres subalbatus]|uniref:transcription initiation factor TFIID subunit 3-like n=1 Tax=Armigeres subalbatus TaxID=124917 RepID=UPI002ED195FD